MKVLLGFLLILIGAVLGIYVGVYVLLWGGAVSMFEGLTQGLFWTFIWGAIKWALSGLLGWGLFYLFGAFGTVLMGD